MTGYFSGVRKHGVDTARLIQDLEKKIDFYERPNRGAPDVVTPLHGYIAGLLEAGTVYPRVLNRATVLGLLQGQATWLHDEEGWQPLKDPVPLAELEQQRVVTFKSGLLEVVRPVPVADDMPQKLKQQLATVASLYDIKHGGDGWVAPHARVDECFVTEVGHLQACHKLSASHGGYKISFEDEDLVGVGTLLWEQGLKGEAGGCVRGMVVKNGAGLRAAVCFSPEIPLRTCARGFSSLCISVRDG
ncbi:hypothetical protein E8E78_16445 [Pseudomonas sp. BN505]|uniref:hypothetical protein n=1 Tax=unclassified Pseudomonas TaxID=196821 RepID=UPI002453FE2F|nr:MULTISPECIES: hypothetical protein [unclassified Pseudomonas]MDH4842434.1 hypothetical protein [Pseudomonas sp. BN605]MDH4858169.1 hypothetical protein [Pseudomonas sp. BN505]